MKAVHTGVHSCLALTRQFVAKVKHMPPRSSVRGAVAEALVVASMTAAECNKSVAARCYMWFGEDLSWSALKQLKVTAMKGA